MDRRVEPLKHWWTGGPQSIWARGAQFLLMLAVWSVGFDLAGDRMSIERWMIAVTAAAAGALVLHRRGRPSQSMPTRTDDVTVVAAAANSSAIAAGLLSIGVDDLFSTMTISIAVLVAGWLAIFVGLLLLRGLIRELFCRSHGQRVAVIGVGEDAHEVTGLLLDHPESNLQFIGVIGDLTTAERSGLAELWLGSIDQLGELLEDHRVDVAMVTTTGFRSAQFRRILGVLRLSGVEPMLSTGVARLDAASLRVSSVVHEPLVSIDWSQSSGTYAWTKRTIDVLGASLGLILASPIMAVAAILIKLDDRGPVLYRSPRIGADNVGFGMLKFRSMRVNAHEQQNQLAQRNERSGPLFKMTNDPRTTRVGRVLRETSIDELPQLVNVLKGDMSLVGPRPALPEEASAFDEDLRARFSLKPGVTGLWQVEARSNPNFTAYRRLDLHYVANHSPRIDLQILVATVVQVLVAAILLPIRPFLRRRPGGEVIESSASVIDLRERLRHRQPEGDQEIPTTAP